MTSPNLTVPKALSNSMSRGLRTHESKAHHSRSVGTVLTSINEQSSLKVSVLEDRVTLGRTGSLAEPQLNSWAMVNCFLDLLLRRHRADYYMCNRQEA